MIEKNLKKNFPRMKRRDRNVFNITTAIITNNDNAMKIKENQILPGEILLPQGSQNKIISNHHQQIPINSTPAVATASETETQTPISNLTFHSQGLNEINDFKEYRRCQQEVIMATTSSTAKTTQTVATDRNENMKSSCMSSSNYVPTTCLDVNYIDCHESKKKLPIVSSLLPPSSSSSSSNRPPLSPLQPFKCHNRTFLSSFDFMKLSSVFSLIFLIIGDFQIGVATALQHNRDMMIQNQLKKPEPMFITRSETFKFVAGSTILLPCEVAETAEFVVAWKRGIAILSAGSVKVTPDPRVRLVNGFNLQIRDAVPQDAGDYICQIAMLEPREITHTVEILVPPRIHHISSGGHLQVKKGASVRIECSASGNPTPNVTWSRKNNILPNGEETLHSTILSVENMDRHKGGVYICKANNGVGQAASSQVILHVLYPPEISIERPVVYSGEGHEAMLVCIVHGEAQPEVIWFKETMQLDTTERHIMENRGSRHTLIIRKVHPQDFGNYSCVAENQLGKSRKTLQLSGKPNTAVFSSPPISQYKDRYNISWTVDSHTPVEEFKLYFRRLPQGHEVDNTIEQSQPLHLLSSSSSSSSSMHMYGSGGGGGIINGIGNNNNNLNSHNHRGGYNVHWPRSDWRDVVLPAVPLSHHYTQGMSYMIRGLEPDQHYEAKVNARNRYGWSDLTESFLFSTSSNDVFSDPSSFRNLGFSDNEMRDLSVTFYGSSTRSTSITITSFIATQILSIFVYTILRLG